MHYYHDPTISLTDYLAVVTVPCEKEEHQIGVRKDGALVFFHHDSTVALTEKLRKDAGMPAAHNCGRQHRQWLRGDEHDLTRALAIAYAQIVRGKRHERRRRRNYCNWHKDSGYSATCPACTGDRLRLPFVDRAHSDSINKARAALKRSCYRTGETQDQHGQHDWSIVCDSQPSVAGRCDRRFKAGLEYNEDSGRYVGRSVPCTEIVVKIKPSWRARVHAEGLALVSGGLFVLDVLAKKDDDHYTLLVAKQSRGYSVIPAAASYHAGDDKLHWL